MKKIRWGIAGPGVIAHKFAEAVKNVECAELVAVASRSLERASTFAEEFDIPKVFGSYENMAEFDGVDAVYVSTAHPFHKSTAEVFLKAKKHVLCEKPLCVNEKQARELKNCAKENDVFLMEAMWTRFLPAIEEAKKIVLSGEIGEVMEVTADFCYAIEYDEDPKVFENNMAGGSLLDVGVYALHFADVIFDDEPECIKTSANVINGADVHARMVIEYGNGKMATLSSAIALEKPADAQIFGTKGRIYIPDFYQAERLVVTKDGQKEILLPYEGNGFEGEILEVCRCIEANKRESDILPLGKSIKILEQMDEIRKQINVRYPMDK